MSNIKYTINLMWINRALNPNQEYILSNINLLINAVKSWTNHGHQVNIWYDSNMTTPNQIQNTKNIIDNMIDVQNINQVKENLRVFSDKAPVYFRADLLRTITAVHYLHHTNDDYFVYADLDVESISKNELFDEKTLNHLQTKGIVLAKNKITEFENGFQIIANKPNTLLALQHAIIDLNITRAYNAFNNKFKEIGTNNSPIKSLSESVFYSYTTMFKYLYYLNNDGILYKTSTLDDIKKYGFGLDDEIFSYDKHKHCFNPNFVCKFSPAASLYYSPKTKFTIPTKNVVIPPPQGNYNKYLPDSELYWYQKLFYKLW